MLEGRSFVVVKEKKKVVGEKVEGNK